MTKQSNGFTVIELLFIALLLGTASILFFIQKNGVEISAQDNVKKIAINSMYYSLEEVFYTANSYYPQTINSDNLKSVDPALFTDPDGIKLGEAGSAYTYKPTDCADNKCKSYALKAKLAKEADFIKTNKNK